VSLLVSKNEFCIAEIDELHNFYFVFCSANKTLHMSKDCKKRRCLCYTL
jgi:hypothetical protein